MPVIIVGANAIFLFFGITRKTESIWSVSFIGISLLLTHLYAIVDYFSSHSSTSGLIFIFLPIYELILLGLLFLSHKKSSEPDEGPDFEPVTVCDRMLHFPVRKPEHEVFEESTMIALNRLIECLHPHAVRAKAVEWPKYRL